MKTTKHFLRNNEFVSLNGPYLVGPIPSGSPNEHWYSLSIRFKKGVPPEDITIDILTAVVERPNVGTITPDQIRTFIEQDLQSNISAPIINRFAVDDSLVNVSPVLTSVSRLKRNQSGNLVRETSSQQPTYEAVGETGLVWRRYPTLKDHFSLRLWHRPGDRHGLGTDLCVAIFVDGTINQDWAVEVETYSDGWERELPAIYRRPTTDPPPDDGVTYRNVSSRSTPAVTNQPVEFQTASVLLDGLLGLFETNATIQSDAIKSVSDFFVPAYRPFPKNSQDLADLASYLGVELGDLNTQPGNASTIMTLIANSFSDFRARGTKATFVKLLRLFSNAILINKVPQIRDDCLHEPLLEKAIFFLDDASVFLDDSHVLLANIEKTALKDQDMKSGPDFQFVGCDDLVGFAHVKVNWSEFENDKDRQKFQELVMQLSPAYMTIGVEFSGRPAKLNRASTLGHSILG